jgi:hypothetical protein
MKDDTTDPVVRKTLVDLLIRWLSAIGGKIFLADDRLARDQGWESTSGHGGLSRNYRDRRFNYLAACQACRGHGHDSYGVSCAGCGGTGRVLLDTTEASQPWRRP